MWARAHQSLNGEQTGVDQRDDRAQSQRPTPPKNIKIGNLLWTVELVKHVPGAAEFYGLSGRTCGSRAKEQGFCKVNNRIYVEAGLPLNQERITLLHELQHGILGSEKSDRQATYHQFIYELSPKLLEVLQENPDLYIYLTAQEKGPSSQGKD